MKTFKLGPGTTLLLVILISIGAISVLVARAATSNLSYYLTPSEYLLDEANVGKRVRVAGRVVEGSIVNQDGRLLRFDIVGDINDRIAVEFSGQVVPNLFGPYALVLVEGLGEIDYIAGDQIIIKHENEFFAGEIPEESISSNFVKPKSTSDEDEK